MAGSERVAACDQMTRASAYRPPWEFELDEFEPCLFCFSDEEVDVDEEDLLVTKSSGGKLHRHERTGPADFTRGSESRPVTNLAKQLQKEDVTDPSDIDADRAFGRSD